MNKKQKPTREDASKGDAFRINGGPSSDATSSGDRKQRKPQGRAFQINGDCDSVERLKGDEKQ